MAHCPKCDYKLRLTDVSQNCPKCGANLRFWNYEEKFTHDAKNAELSMANARRWIALIKAAFIGDKRAVIRLVCVLLPVLSLLAPLATVKLALPISEQVFTLSGLGIYGAVNGGLFPVILAQLGSGPFSGAYRMLAVMLVFYVLTALCAVANLLTVILGFTNLKRTPKAMIGISGAAIVSAAASVICAAIGSSSAAMSVKPGIGIAAVVAGFGAFIAVNAVIIATGGIEPVLKEGDAERYEIRKKVLRGETDIDDLPFPVVETEETRKIEDEIAKERENVDNSKSEEEVDKEERSIFAYENDPKRDRLNKLIYRGVVIVLAFMFVFGSVYGGYYVLHMEGAEEPYVPAESASPMPESVEEISDYLRAAFAKVTDGMPRTVIGESCGINGDTVAGADLSAASSGIADFSEKGFEDAWNAIGNNAAELEYGSDLGAAVPASPDGGLIPSADGISSATIKDTYYICPICGEDYDEPVAVCEECQTDEPQLLRYRDDYSVTLELKELSPLFAKTLGLKTGKDVADILNRSATPYYSEVTEADVSYEAPRISASVSRLTDRINSLRITADARISAKLDTAEGPTELSFVMSDSVEYRFTWPGVKFEKAEYQVEPGKEIDIHPVLYCDAPESMEAVLRIEDESLASLTRSGYVKAGKEAGDVVLAADFDYLGKTYTDTCVVHIRVPVESAKISKYSLKLAAGESAALSASVSPKKASIQTVTWHSSDESVVKVDENGVVTAVAPGNAEIYVLSDDGYFRSTCKVEVK